MKNRIAALALLTALALTGCAGTAAPEVDERATSAESESESESAAPLVAESPSPDAEVGTDEAFLIAARDALEANGGSSIPNATDEQLLAAGADACEQMRAGADMEDLRLVEGEQPTETGYTDSTRIAGSAAKHLCLDMDQS